MLALVEWVLKIIQREFQESLLVGFVTGFCCRHFPQVAFSLSGWVVLVLTLHLHRFVVHFVLPLLSLNELFQGYFKTHKNNFSIQSTNRIGSKCTAVFSGRTFLGLPFTRVRKLCDAFAPFLLLVSLSSDLKLRIDLFDFHFQRLQMPRQWWPLICLHVHCCTQSDRLQLPSFRQFLDGFHQLRPRLLSLLFA